MTHRHVITAFQWTLYLVIRYRRVITTFHLTRPMTTKRHRVR